MTLTRAAAEFEKIFEEYLLLAALTPFPPVTWLHIGQYLHEEIMAGFMAYKRGANMPESDRSPSYRWGYQCAVRESQDGDDGFDHLRDEYRANR